MRKIILLIIAITGSLQCLSQKIAFSKAIALTPPQGVEVLNKDQYYAYGNNQFKHSETAVNNVARTTELNDNKHFYKFNDIFIALVHSDKPVPENHLVQIKNGFDEMNNKLKDTNHYNSVIKTINGNHVLIMYHDGENVGYYNFHCWSAAYKHVVTGTIQFNIVDKDNAIKTLDNLLKGVEFNE